MKFRAQMLPGLFLRGSKSEAERDIFKGVDALQKHAPLNMPELYLCSCETTHESGLMCKGRQRNIGLREEGRKSKRQTELKNEHLSRKGCD